MEIENNKKGICLKDLILIFTAILIYLIGFEFLGKKLGNVAILLNSYIYNIEYSFILFFISGVFIFLINFIVMIIYKFFIKKIKIRRYIFKTFFYFILLMPFVMYVVYLIVKNFNKNWWIFIVALIIIYSSLSKILKVIFVNTTLVKKIKVNNDKIEKYLSKISKDLKINIEGVYVISNIYYKSVIDGILIGIGKNKKFILSEKYYKELLIDEIGFLCIHEYTHIKNQDKLLAYILFLLRNGLIFYIISNLINLTEDVYLGIFKGMFFLMIFNIFGIILEKIILFLREYKADIFAVKFIKNYEIAFSAIKKFVRKRTIIKNICFMDYLRAIYPSESMRILKVKRKFEKMEEKFE